MAENRKTTPNNKYIHWTIDKRIDGNPGGYQVRIYNIPKINTMFAYFPCLKYGGKRKAFKAAQQWRNAILKEYKITHVLYEYQSDTPRKNYKPNRSGVIGIYNTSTHINGHKYPSWWVRWSYHKVQKQTAYSINKHGNEKAFLMCCKIRLSKTGELVITDQSKLPVTVKKIKNYLKDNPYAKNIYIH